MLRTQGEPVDHSIAVDDAFAGTGASTLPPGSAPPAGGGSSSGYDSGGSYGSGGGAVTALDAGLLGLLFMLGGIARWARRRRRS